MGASSSLEAFENRKALLEDFTRLGKAVAGSAASLDQLAAIVARTIEHSQSFDLLAVFDAEIDEFEIGRVVLFQDFVRENTGIAIRHVKVMAACIKVFFEMPSGWEEKRNLLKALFISELFEEIRIGLDLSYVQFAGELFPPQHKKSY